MTARIHIASNLSLPAEDFIEAKLAIVGQSGRGKSGLLKVIEEELVRTGLPFVVFDPAGVAWGIKSSIDGKGPGLPVLVIGGEHADLKLNRKAGAETARAIVQANVSCVIDFSEESKASYREFVKDFADAIYALNDTSRLLIFDEAPELLPQKIRPDQTQVFDAVERLVRMGRNRGLGVILVSQRAATINKDVLTQCGSLVIFGLVGTPDRKALREWVEAKADPTLLAEFMEGIAGLKVREAWFWSPQEFEQFTRIRVNEFHTLHPDRTHLRKMGLLKAKAVTVDVSGVVARLGATLQRVAAEKAEDREAPRLRAEVERLKRQLAEPMKKADTIDVQRAVAEGRRPLEEMVKTLEGQLEKSRQWAVKVGYIGVQLEDGTAEILGAPPASARLMPKTPVFSIPPKSRFAVTPTSRLVVSTMERPRLATPADAQVAPSNGGTEVYLKKGAVRMLAELASRHPLTLTRSQLASLAGFTASGGTFTTYLSRLKQEGFLVDEHDGSVRVTPAGLGFVGEVPPAPSTHAEVMARWSKALKAGTYRMLEAVVGAGREGIIRPNLATDTGFAETGGTFTTYLSILRRNGLVTEENGMIKATDVLFP